MTDAILTLNAGSSNLKFGLYERGGRKVLGGRIDNSSAPTPALQFEQVEAALGGLSFAIVGHRIVHGGAGVHGPAPLEEGLLGRLRGLSAAAPLHQPQSLALVDAVSARHPGMLQIGCFDTAFHASLKPEAWRFALPRRYEQEGLRRYGFHGLSYEFIAARLRQISPHSAQGRVIVAHLGAGSSLCAMHDGISVDTSMGFTPLDGLAMATRCGALDPGALLYLLRQGQTVAELEDMLYRKSGLLGVSGLSGDMRILLASEAPAARDAMDLYVFRVVREIGALAASLGGLDGLVFTGGIGENAAMIRARVCDRLAWLGLHLAPEANARNDAAIGTAASIGVWVLPTDEEAVIARQSMAFLAG